MPNFFVTIYLPGKRNSTEGSVFPKSKRRLLFVPFVGARRNSDSISRLLRSSKSSCRFTDSIVGTSVRAFLKQEDMTVESVQQLKLWLFQTPNLKVVTQLYSVPGGVVFIVYKSKRNWKELELIVYKLISCTIKRNISPCKCPRIQRIAKCVTRPLFLEDQ